MKKALHLALAAALPIYSGTVLALDNSGILTNITDRYYRVASSWASTILAEASVIFWILASISLAWTGTVLLMRRADIQEFFAEFIKFIVTLGFFYWLLQNGPTIGKAIIDSFVRMGGHAIGTPLTAPSGILDMGFQIVFKTYDHMSVTSPWLSMAGIFLAVAVLVFLAIIAANLTVQYCAAWIMLYAGCILLGFGGSRWTSDMAIQYYKSILGIALSLMTIILMLGVGKSILDQYFAAMSGDMEIKELTVILVVVVIMFVLINKVPAYLAGMVTHGLAHSGIGTYGIGLASATAGVAASAAVLGARYGSSGLGFVARKSGASSLVERIRAGQRNAANTVSSSADDLILGEISAGSQHKGSQG